MGPASSGGICGAGLSGGGLGAGALLLRVLPVAPDEAVDRDQPWDVTQAGDERYSQQQYRGHAGHVDRDHVDVGGIGPAWDLVPQRVQPEPRLAGVAAGLVHYAPLIAAEVH